VQRKIDFGELVCSRTTPERHREEAPPMSELLGVLGDVNLGVPISKRAGPHD